MNELVINEITVWDFVKDCSPGSLAVKSQISNQRPKAEPTEVSAPPVGCEEPRPTEQEMRKVAAGLVKELAKVATKLILEGCVDDALKPTQQAIYLMEALTSTHNRGRNCHYAAFIAEVTASRNVIIRYPFPARQS